jgi:hypothetical protein
MGPPNSPVLDSSVPDMANIIPTEPFPSTTGSMTPSSTSSLENVAAMDAGRARAFTVAISGCSSSGKTVISLALKQIFTGLNLSATGITGIAKLDRSGDATVPLAIHEDIYFTRKSNCPLVTFKSSQADAPFMQKSLRDDELGQYYLHWDGKRALSNGVQGQSIAPGWQPTWMVSGPDSDCWEAIDILALTKVRTFSVVSFR